MQFLKVFYIHIYIREIRIQRNLKDSYYHDWMKCKVVKAYKRNLWNSGRWPFCFCSCVRKYQDQRSSPAKEIACRLMRVHWISRWVIGGKATFTRTANAKQSVVAILAILAMETSPKTFSCHKPHEYYIINVFRIVSFLFKKTILSDSSTVIEFAFGNQVPTEKTLITSSWHFQRDHPNCNHIIFALIHFFIIQRLVSRLNKFKFLV